MNLIIEWVYYTTTVLRVLQFRTTVSYHSLRTAAIKSIGKGNRYIILYLVSNILILIIQ
jgi:hypothetical protein